MEEQANKNDEKDVFEGHPYSSPDTSDDDNKSVDLDFTEFDSATVEDPSSKAPIIEDPFGDDDEIPSWCNCGNCSIDCPLMESVCCNDKPEVESLLRDPGDCIIDNHFFRVNILSEEGILYSRDLIAAHITNSAEKNQYLSVKLTNALKRNIAYRNFMLYVNKYIPLGHRNRVVLPRCVVLKIRQTFPDANHCYTVFRPAV